MPSQPRMKPKPPRQGIAHNGYSAIIVIRIRPWLAVFLKEVTIAEIIPQERPAQNLVNRHRGPVLPMRPSVPKIEHGDGAGIPADVHLAHQARWTANTIDVAGRTGMRESDTKLFPISHVGKPCQGPPRALCGRCREHEPLPAANAPNRWGRSHEPPFQASALPAARRPSCIPGRTPNERYAMRSPRQLSTACAWASCPPQDASWHLGLPAVLAPDERPR